MPFTRKLTILYPSCRHCFWKLDRRLLSTVAPKAEWKSVVGLEIHAQIASESKLFSGAPAGFTAPVNENVSFFDAAIPGTLPVLNRKCVEAGIFTAAALQCKINPVSLFDRKHYFYADLPAGYQITQQRLPLAQNGNLNFEVFQPTIHKFPVEKSCRVHQLQLEQDSGKSLHDERDRKTLVDLNRAGVPLMEIVFEPDLQNGEEAASLVRELILILLTLNTCTCKMEFGALRVDANVSLHREGEPLGVRTEIKNIGSVRSVCNAVDYEIKRQMTVLDKGGVIENETRVWDADSKQTLPMRDKEEKQDYRFMPEPNLPPLRVSLDDEDSCDPNIYSVNAITKKLPELPCVWREKMRNEYGISKVITYQLINKTILMRHYQSLMMEKPDRNGALAANYLVNYFLTSVYKHKVSLENLTIDSSSLGEIIDLLQDGTINHKIAHEIVTKLLNGDSDSPKKIVKKHDLKQICDIDVITKILEQAIENNRPLVDQYCKGKTKALNKLLQVAVEISGNRLNSKLASEKLSEILNKRKEE